MIERHRPTLFFSVPTGYGMLLAHQKKASGSDTVGEDAARGDFDLSSVRLAVSAGRRCRRRCTSASRRASASTSSTASVRPKRRTCSSRIVPAHIRPGSSGLLVDGYEARLLDDSGQPTPPGEIGNLWMSGDSVCALYWNQHEKTKDTIQGRWLRTGDKYTQDADGYYWYAGRTDDMLKVGGLWVSPIEVENALVAHVAVLECGVVGREDHDGLVKPMAFVVLREGVPARRISARAAAVRAPAPGRVQAAAVGRVHRGVAEDRDRQDPALPPARRVGRENRR